MSAQLETTSAADVRWRQIQVNVWPSPGGLWWSVLTRAHKGSTLVWQRHLGTAGLDYPGEAPIESLAEIFRTLSEAFEELAQRAERDT